jgi:hypothetical protein
MVVVVGAEKVWLTSKVVSSTRKNMLELVYKSERLTKY